MKVKLTRRHGSRQAGEVHDYRNVMAHWLIDRGFAEPVKAEPKPAARTEEKGDQESVTPRRRAAPKPDTA